MRWGKPAVLMKGRETCAYNDSDSGNTKDTMSSASKFTGTSDPVVDNLSVSGSDVHCDHVGVSGNMGHALLLWKTIEESLLLALDKCPSDWIEKAFEVCNEALWVEFDEFEALFPWLVLASADCLRLPAASVLQQFSNDATKSLNRRSSLCEQ